MGRKTTYTDQIANRICDRIADGESLKAICRDGSMPDNSTVLRWVKDRPEFQDVYTAAMQARLDAWAEDVIVIADGEEASPDAVQRDRLKIETRKWLMARLAPKKYGDKLDMNVAADIAVKHRPDLSGLTRDERDQLRALLETNAARLAAPE